MGYYEENIKQEIKTMKAKRAFALQANDYDAFRSLIDELCHRVCAFGCPSASLQ